MNLEYTVILTFNLLVVLFIKYIMFIVQILDQLYCSTPNVVPIYLKKNEAFDFTSKHPRENFFCKRIDKQISGTYFSKCKLYCLIYYIYS